MPRPDDLIKRSDAIGALIRTTVYDSIKEIEDRCLRLAPEDKDAGWLCGIRDAIDAISCVRSANVDLAKRDSHEPKLMGIWLLKRDENGREFLEELGKIED